MAIPAPILRIPTVRLLAARPSRAICCRLRDLAVVLVVVRALSAVVPETAAGLSADAHPLTFFDPGLVVLAHADGFTNNLVANHNGIVCWAPSGAEEVQICTADTAVGDFDLAIR